MKKRQVKLVAMICIFAALFLGAGGRFFYIQWRLRQEADLLRRMAEAVDVHVMDYGDESSDKSYGSGTGMSLANRGLEGEAEQMLVEERLAGYQLLAARNPDMVGWIRLEGSTIDYPLMQRKEEGTYYLHRDFAGAYSYSGLPFLDAACDVEQGSCWLIYGHNMRNQTMFAGLHRFAERDYWEQHPVLYIDTLEEMGEYTVFSVFYTDISQLEKGQEAFRYYELPGETEKAFEAYAEALTGLALYETGKRPAYGSRLVLLTTCSSHSRDGRLVVAAYGKKSGFQKVFSK